MEVFLCSKTPVLEGYRILINKDFTKTEGSSFFLSSIFWVLSRMSLTPTPPGYLDPSEKSHLRTFVRVFFVFRVFYFVCFWGDVAV